MLLEFKEIKKTIKYFHSPKKYYKNIELCGLWTDFIAKFIADRMHLDCKRGTVISFSASSLPILVKYKKTQYKIFYTRENTHVQESYWQQFENLWLKEPSLSLICGFDYAEHPKYIRFPFWLERLFGPMATQKDIADFVKLHNLSNPSNRTKDCAFICKRDYFGDRAQMADWVEQIMPINYPSDFCHNDDDMREKYGDDKIEYLRQFRFNLCPENSNNKGYVTEKIFEAIKADCVPVYWGNEGYPEPDILNPKAIIYLDKDKPEEGLALLRRLYDDPKAYAEFASQKRFLPGAEQKIYAYYERLEEKLRDVLGSE